MLGQVCVVVCALGVGKGHEEHVAAFFQWHVFGLAIGVTWQWVLVFRGMHANDAGITERTSGVREGGSDVLDGILVGPVACLLVDEEGVEEVLEKRGVGVDGDGVEGEYHFCQSSQSTAASMGRW